jgi:hypothetical protein
MPPTLPLIRQPQGLPPSPPGKVYKSSADISYRFIILKKQFSHISGLIDIMFKKQNGITIIPSPAGKVAAEG